MFCIICGKKKLKHILERELLSRINTTSDICVRVRACVCADCSRCPPVAVPSVEDDQVGVGVQGQSRWLTQQEGSLGPVQHLLIVKVCNTNTVKFSSFNLVYMSCSKHTNKSKCINGHILRVIFSLRK